MVHVKKCPHRFGRSKPSTEFYKDGKPQIYCYGWINMITDDTDDICQKCADHVDNAQDDLDAYLKGNRRANENS